ncbi:outer membrane protein transport protein [Paraglaciecola sp. 20A4]|uniref:outer membrane protein transport protein n=1 Tax=Paraglaciecola sp. 20A4 TaxID=2687288 RepID=UPI00140A1F13|nr:outer membrane protein transport protein [Paraglaciecola sp. 20A4]
MKLNKILLAAGLSTLSLNTFAAAFQLSEHSASGLGRAFAGDAAIAENASVVARNPALMSQFSENQLSVVGTYIVPDVSLTGESAPVYSSAAGLDDDSIAPEAFVPATYFVMPIDDKFAVGFGLFSNFGLATEFDEDYAAGQLAGKTEIVTINFNSSVSYKLNDRLTVAGGLNIIYADATITRHLGDFSNALAANGITVPASTLAVDLEGDDYGYGYNLGVAYDIDENSRFGFHYRSKVDITFDGTYTNELPLIPSVFPNGQAGESQPGTVNIELPAIAEFSGSHKLDEKWGLHYSVMWTHWSSFERLEAYVPSQEDPIFEKEENFSDSFRYAIGTDYQLNAKVKLRAGIAYDETPTDSQLLSISIPDTNRLWLSAGANYLLDDSSSIDLGLSIVRGQDRTFTEADDAGGQWEFSSEGNAFILAAQYNYAF